MDLQVDAATNREQIVCYCNHLTSFGSDLLVAPNPIDFDSVFKNFGSLAENVAVLALISTILGFYIIGVVWARRADKRDALLVGVFNVDANFLTIPYHTIPYHTIPYHIILFHIQSKPHCTPSHSNILCEIHECTINELITP